MINTFYDAYSVLSKVYSDGAYLSQAIAETAIEPLGKAKTVKIVYGVLDKDIYLEYVISKLCERSPKQKIKILIKIAMYAYGFLGNKDYAVTDSVVELAKKLGKGGSAGFINAVLRKYYSAMIPMPEDVYERISVENSYPLFAVEKLVGEYGEDAARKIVAFDEETAFARFSSKDAGEKYLTENGYKFSHTPFDDLFSVKKLTINDDFKKGVFTFQSIGSAAICEVCGSGGKLLDVCAAPGGKSVYLSRKYLCVVSAELYPHRAELIRSYAKRMGADNIEVVVADATKYNSCFERSFDTVLCDVPCSGFGTIKDNPDLKFRRTKESVFEITKTQSAIIQNASRYVRAGGVLIYSTCSIFEEENDKIVENFLKNARDYEMCPIVSPLPSLEKKYGRQFLPHISMGAGFYVSKLVCKV